MPLHELPPVLQKRLVGRVRERLVRRQRAEKHMYTRIYYCVCDMATRKSRRGLQLYLIKDTDGTFTVPYRDVLTTESVASASIPKARRLLQTGFCNVEQVRFSEQPVVLWQNIQMYAPL